MEKILDCQRNHKYSDAADKISIQIVIYFEKCEPDNEFISDYTQGLVFRYRPNGIHAPYELFEIL